MAPFIVMVSVMLSMLLALWASRTSLFNEMVVGNDTDYQFAFEAAQALAAETLRTRIFAAKWPMAIYAAPRFAART